ncbi:hypothetical protein HAU32_09530 [Weissella confusa]|uniref:Transcriptional regulator n=1 Tax=Weissella fermenti TaxID=2987699 RepID=A0ABT6D204_9LACO|nr:MULTISPECIES: hypothetical protein [Weissella]MBJ7689204.1 hypothetical protein [Weissella confusa]MCW0927091.1 hypothetical protein [Weissella sp. LMG 11983]MDF9299529.1 hypothetical protein [Weissella sp. BK2]
MAGIDTPILNAVRKVIELKHISVRDILQHTAISSGRYYTFINGQGDITVHKLHAILKTLNVGLAEIGMYMPHEEIEQDLTLDQMMAAIESYRQTRSVTEIIALAKNSDEWGVATLPEEMIIRLKPVLMDLLRRTENYTLAEIKVVLLYLNYFTYDDLREQYKKLRRGLRLQIQLSEEHGGAIRHEAVQVIGMLLFELIVMHAEHGQRARMDELVAIFYSMQVKSDDWTTAVLREVINVIRLVIAGKQSLAKQKYDTVREMIQIFQPKENWPYFERVMGESFESFTLQFLWVELEDNHGMAIG